MYLCIFHKLAAILIAHTVIASEPKCGFDSHWVKAHHRNGYTKGNGTVVKEADVDAHCRKNPAGYVTWLPKLKSSIPEYWGNKTEQVLQWTEDEKERLFEALSEIPDLLKRDFEAIHRLKNLEHPENPASTKGVTFQHIGILSLEFHVDKLSRPLL